MVSCGSREWGAWLARYFFDIHDGRDLRSDAEGTICDGSEAIKDQAMRTLPEFARSAIPRSGARQAFTVLVRNERNLMVYTATMTFSGLWLCDA